MHGLVGRTIGRYHILEEVGQGGMSSVFRAVELTTNRTVAIKVISPYLANEPQFQARFEREIRLLRRLQHPNIIPILDFGEADGLAYIVMPFIATGTLHERLQQGPLDPVQGGRIIDQIASALTLCPRRRGHPPRRQAVECPARPGWQCDSLGLRIRAAPERVAEPDWLGPDRHPRVHVARAVPRRTDRRAFGPVLVRRHALPDHDRASFLSTGTRRWRSP